MITINTIDISKASLLRYNPQLLRNLIITNDTDETFENLSVIVEGVGVRSNKINLPTIHSGNSCKVDNLIVEIENLNEEFSVPTDFNYCISIVNNESVIEDVKCHICILPENYWSFQLQPETIIAHVCPEDSYIQTLLIRAEALLEKYIDEPGFSDYQTCDPNNVRAQAAAIYSSLASITFQEDVFPGKEEPLLMRKIVDVLSSGHGTNLDLALIMASALEAIHIRPLIVFLKNEVILGVWLEKNHRPTSYNDEISSLLNFCADGVNRMVLIRPKAILSKRSFEQAVSEAESLCRESNAKYFGSGYVDIFTARIEWAYLLQGDDVFSENYLRHQESIVIDSKATTSTTKQDIWERKLLDFSLRNTLLNMRKRAVLPFVSFNINSIEDSLQDENVFQILEYPQTPTPETDESGIFISSTYREQLEQLVLSGIGQKRLYSFRKGEELNSILKNLYRSSRVALEENGANTLFLNLGVLRWYETKRSTVARHAPLILLPVDLIRKGGTMGYVLKLRDEEPVFNITIVEYLRQNFQIDLNSLFPLPTDASGLDIRKIFTIVRHAIAEQPRWDLLEEMGIGLFSFSKFVMWNDIHNHRPVLEQHPIIKSLIVGKLLDNTLVKTIPANKLDNLISPTDVALPVDVDSSQMEAIVDAGNGKSFILYGPPGTGKSQTITNMIANALFKGQRVLFVAEKRAALEVVQNRLSKIGLDPFCLELHSNKVNKQHVLLQLQKSLNVRHISHHDDFDLDAEKTKEKRKDLMDYVRLLHVVQNHGLSLYDCITRYISIGGDEIAHNGKCYTTEQLKDYAEQVANLDVVFQISGHPSDSVYTHFLPKDFQRETITSISTLLQELVVILDKLHQIYKCISEEFGLTLPNRIENEEKNFAFIKCLLSTPFQNKELVEVVSNKAKRDFVEEKIILGETRDNLKERLLSIYNDNVLSIDVIQLEDEYMEAQAKWFIPRQFALRKLLRKVNILIPTLRYSEEIKTLIDNLIYYNKIENQVKESSEYLQLLFAESAIPNNESWDTMRSRLNQLHTLCENWKQLAGVHFYELRDALIASEDHWSDLQEKHSAELLSLIEGCNRLNIAWQELKELAIFSIKNGDTISDIASQIKQWSSHSEELLNWCQYVLRKQSLLAVGLHNVIEYLESGHKTGHETADAFLKGVYRQYAKDIIDSNAQLSLFNGLLFEQQIQKYCDLVSEFQYLTKRELYCRLAKNIPLPSTFSANSSEMGLLRRNIANGGRGNSIRNLVTQIPNLLPKLCPCMLMSPLSVSQYLDIKNQPFDLVIFDEASQMPTSEAIGAIARGKSLVVVGDPKQMPPTSFFQVQQDDDEDVNIDDLESILDDCRVLSMPEHFLSWHYRSRHESLISFSNHQYYDGHLVTFPSADNRESKVRLVHIDGHYDKGKTRCNKAEANAIVEEVLKRLRSQRNAFKEGKDIQSIGIVSFSQVQQNMIEDLLMDALDNDQELKEIAFNEYEPIFIKNLENVQGDERDIILFSVGYGPDATGRVSMNFGPLNKKGGERRLNVAVSRARYEMIVYSTLNPEQIDLKRTSARGVEGLRSFLEFAREGKMPIPASHSIENKEMHGLILSIADSIRSMGYQVDTLVGASNFHVDIAVVSPTDNNKYILGILLDGVNYYATPTTRDRNIVQPKVLSGLGWNIIRIWSVDWFNNRKFVIGHLKKMLDLAEKGENIPSCLSFSSVKTFNVEDEQMEELYAAKIPFEKKDIEQVPTWKLQDELLKAVEEEIAIPEDELKRLTSKRLGYAHMGAAVERSLSYQIKSLLIIQKLDKTDDGKIMLGKNT